jgi:hypothetical protein
MTLPEYLESLNSRYLRKSIAPAFRLGFRQMDALMGFSPKQRIQVTFRLRPKNDIACSTPGLKPGVI